MVKSLRLPLKIQLFSLLSIMIFLIGILWAIESYKMAEYYQSLFHKESLSRQQQVVNGALEDARKHAEMLVLTLSSQLEKFPQHLDRFAQAAAMEKNIEAIFVRSAAGWRTAYDNGKAAQWHKQLISQHSRSLPESLLVCHENHCHLIFYIHTYSISGKLLEVVLIQGAGEWFENISRDLMSDKETIALVSIEKGLPKLFLASNYPLAREVLENLSAKKTQVLTSDTFSNWWLHRIALPLPYQAKHPMWLVSIQDISVLQQGLIHMLLVSLIVLIGLWGGIGWLILWAANKKLTPLQQLSTAMALATQGKLQNALTCITFPKKNIIRDELTRLQVHMRRMLQTLQRRTEQLHWMAYHDTLTGLPNRRSFYRVLKAQHQKGEGALLFIDVNRFKQVNDVFGHEAGDDLLKHIADKLKTLQHDHDLPLTPFRLAGDEFTVIIQSSIDLQTLKAFMDSLTHTLKGRIQLPKGETIFYEVSCGGVLIDKNISMDRLLHQADVAMYKAKHGAGLTHWHTFDPERDEDIERLEQEQRLLQWMREKLGTDAFSLVYQPIVDIHTGEVAHYEVLLRLRGPEGKPVSPAQFIPLAERYGLILEIDQWVLGKALEKLHDLPNTVGLSVNLSAPSMQWPDLLSHVHRRLSTVKADSHRIMIELTETAYVSNMQQVENNLNGLKEMGFKLALDDFGVGFSSFSYLSKLPMDTVKLDGSYIKDLPENPRHQAFVRGIVTIAHALKMKVIAEYVENETIIQSLKTLNVDYVQGFYLSPPTPEPQQPINTP